MVKIAVCLCLVAQACPTFVTPWAVARQASLSLGFSRQEYWSGLPFLPPGDLPYPGRTCVSCVACSWILYPLNYGGSLKITVLLTFLCGSYFLSSPVILLGRWAGSMTHEETEIHIGEVIFQSIRHCSILRQLFSVYPQYGMWND